VFVASDLPWASIPEPYRAVLRRFGAVMLPDSLRTPVNDLVVLGLSAHFVGQCTSSFSHFVSRQRQLSGAGTSYWGVDLLAPSEGAGDEGEGERRAPDGGQWQTEL
jgi:hypothetical protein